MRRSPGPAGFCEGAGVEAVDAARSATHQRVDPQYPYPTVYGCYCRTLWYTLHHQRHDAALVEVEIGLPKQEAEIQDQRRMNKKSSNYCISEM